MLTVVKKQALCCKKCGGGSFGRFAPDDPWRCDGCGEALEIAEQVKAAREAQPRPFGFRCGCGSDLFRVGVSGLSCSDCGAKSSFEDLL